MTGHRRPTWTLVGRVDDIPLLEGRSTSVDGRRIAIFRLLDGLAAIDAHCPHAAGPLHDGIVADSCVTCPLHGRRFDLADRRRRSTAPETVAVHEVREQTGRSGCGLPDDQDHLPVLRRRLRARRRGRATAG